MTVLGTRPEIIRLSQVIGRLDRLCEHIVIHTGQNFDPGLSELFFRDLGVRQPNHYLGVRGAQLGDRLGQIFTSVEALMRDQHPDRLLVLGDTDSALTAFVAKRLGIPVYHMEAGNRCYDDRVPEEVNRRVIDHCSDVLMPYTERSRANLLREGIASNSIFVTGNPIYEVLHRHEDEIEHVDVLAELGIESGKYFLLTMHRQENVDVPERLRKLIGAITTLGIEYQLPVICSLHPRTRNRLVEFAIDIPGDGVRFCPPFGFFEFVKLERHALGVLTDSGTVQEECCIFGVPCITLRDTTERPETVECGSNVLSGVEPEAVLRCVRVALENASHWQPPAEYLVPGVSRTVASILLGF